MITRGIGFARRSRAGVSQGPRSGGFGKAAGAPVARPVLPRQRGRVDSFTADSRLDSASIGVVRWDGNSERPARGDDEMFRCVTCQHTFESDAIHPQCPRCGSEHVLYTAPTETDTGQEEGLRPTPRPSGIAWEQRGELGFVNAMVRTIRGCLLEPGETFSNMPPRGDMLSPLLFVIILATIGGAASVVWQSTLENLFSSLLGTDPVSGVPALVERLTAVATVILIPIAVVVSMFVGAGIVHLCLLLLGAGDKGFEATFRTVCYTSGATTWMAVVPFCGNLVAAVWTPVITIIGLHKVHRAPLGRVVVAYFLPLLLCCGVVLAFVAALLPLLPDLID